MARGMQRLAGPDGLSRRAHVLCKRSVRAMTVVVLAATLAGCGALEFLYNRADWLATEYVDDLAGLSDFQASRLSARFAGTLAWHRTEELGEYESILLEAARLVRDGPTAKSVDALLGRMSERRAVLGRRLAGAAASVLGDLSPEQIVIVEDSFASRAADRRDDFAQADKDERAEARQERMRERVEQWTDTLNDTQAERLAKVSATFPDGALVWAAHQSKMESALVAMLRDGANEQAVEQHLANWLGNTGERTAEMERMGDDWRQGIVTVVLEVHDMMTDSQRRHVLELLAEYAGIARSAAAS
jgi:hypothetical protein